MQNERVVELVSAFKYLMLQHGTDLPAFDDLRETEYVKTNSDDSATITVSDPRRGTFEITITQTVKAQTFNGFASVAIEDDTNAADQIEAEARDMVEQCAYVTRAIIEHGADTEPGEVLIAFEASGPDAETVASAIEDRSWAVAGFGDVQVSAISPAP